MRINKFLSQEGICSRREADRLLEAGAISINDEIVELGAQLELGAKINVEGMTLYYTGEEKEKVYLAFNKPKGITCTCSKEDPNNIIDYLNYPERIYPVGRLDQDSKGLIILTNDGELAYKLSHPKFEHQKEYVVITKEKVTDSFIKSMREGVKLEEKTTSPCIAEKMAAFKFRIILKEGLNRQIRRMCKKLGYTVKELIRTRIDNLQLGTIEEGNYVKIDNDKLKELFNI